MSSEIRRRVLLLLLVPQLDNSEVQKTGELFDLVTIN